MKSVSNQVCYIYTLFQFFFKYFCRNINFNSVAHPLSHSMANGIQGHLLAVKRPGREIDLTFPSNAKVKNKWSYTPLTLYAFIL